ncbi:MAG: hypothetical protein AAF235_01100 [Planctomycetota bacterium]
MTTETARRNAAADRPNAPFLRHSVFAALAVASMASATLLSDAPVEAETDTQIVAEAGIIDRLLRWIEGILDEPIVDDPPVSPGTW